MMSSTEEVTEVEEVCASCGITAGDDIKLKKCACDLVKYCGVECQRNHRPQHKKGCKKRIAAMRDDRLFTQPDESHHGECPICCLPLPLDGEKRIINTCCCKRICIGCDYANKKREWEQGLEQRCPYCREVLPYTDEEIHQNLIERAKANDPNALYEMGENCRNEGDYEGAVEHYTKAAKFGNMMAHHSLSYMYHDGQGVEKDMKKAVYHWEEAAIGGHARARYNLGYYEGGNGRFDRATKHFMIAAKQGHDGALKEVERNFRWGFVSKEEYTTALRGHQAVVDATKSQQRDAADEIDAYMVYQKMYEYHGTHCTLILPM